MTEFEIDYIDSEDTEHFLNRVKTKIGIYATDEVLHKCRKDVQEYIHKTKPKNRMIRPEAKKE